MATQLLKTVKPSGGDYTSLEACMNANEQNLVTADKYFDVEIDGTWSSADTTACTIHNYTTDATRYINIYTTSAARHNGTVSTGYELNIYNVNIGLYIANEYVTVDGIRITVLANTAQDVVGLWFNSAFTVLKNSILYSIHNDGAGPAWGMKATELPNGYTVENCFFYDIETCALFANCNSLGTSFFYNNTMLNTGIAIHATTSGGSFTAKNNLALNCGYSWGSSNKTIATNGSSDTSGSEGLQNLVVDDEIVNSGSGTENLHLKAGATSIDSGTDLSATFTDDIDGVTRSGTWDIGADEYVAAGGGETTPYGYMTVNKGWW